MNHPAPAQLAVLSPLAALSPERLNELARLSPLQHAVRGADPLADIGAERGRSVFLLRGELLLRLEGGGTLVIVGGAREAAHALNRPGSGWVGSKAITDVDMVEIDDDTLDVLVTWDEVAAAGAGTDATGGSMLRSDAMLVSSVFSLEQVRDGLFSRMPTAHIDGLFAKFQPIEVPSGQVVIREGDEGDYYYVIESGRCRVDRLVGGARVVLAELKGGDAFGEEALVSEARRNATVTTLTDCRLLRLDRRDFDALLRVPLLQRVAYAEASRLVQDGAQWLDVRYPSEYQQDRLPGAINVPLSEIRNVFLVLDRGRRYIAYCQSGRRSAAAAFLLAQHGFDTLVLEGGLWSARGSGSGADRV